MKKWIPAACLLLAALAAVLYFAVLRPGSPPAAGGAKILLDGEPFSAPASGAGSASDLRVRVTLDGAEIADLPYGEEHSLLIAQDNGFENLLRLSADGVWMERANCEGQDCVHMEKVTRENMETRVLFGMIVCLPHRVTVEVYESRKESFP